MPTWCPQCIIFRFRKAVQRKVSTGGNMKLWKRYKDVVKQNWYHGFTCFGGPAVQVQTVSLPFPAAR